MIAPAGRPSLLAEVGSGLQTVQLVGAYRKKHIKHPVAQSAFFLA